MGANVKSADKKHLTAKSLISEIAGKREAQKNEQGKQGVFRPHHQLEYVFLDVGVVLDACRLLICFIGNNSNYNTTDRQKLEAFIREFVTTFFGISNTRFDVAARPTVVSPQVDEEMPDAGASSGDSTFNRGRGAAGGGRKADLLRGVLSRGRNGRAAQNEGESTAQSGSKETTPDASPIVDDDADGGPGGKGDSEDSSNAAEFNWMQRPDAGAVRKTVPPRPDFAGSEPYRRETYSLYCSTTIYCFFRIFQILCERLLSIKRHEKAAAADVRRAKIGKPAHQLQMITKRPEDYFEDTSPGAHYYSQVLNMVQDVIEGRMDMAHFEDGMRQYYLQVGWQLYTFDRLCSSLARFASTVVSNDAKDKSYDLMQLFYKNREHEETSHDSEITYRKQAEKLIKEGEVYRIEFVSLKLLPFSSKQPLLSSPNLPRRVSSPPSKPVSASLKRGLMC
jgi:paired amphipathic helix protein Sin3a